MLFWRKNKENELIVELKNLSQRRCVWYCALKDTQDNTPNKKAIIEYCEYMVKLIDSNIRLKKKQLQKIQEGKKIHSTG